MTVSNKHLRIIETLMHHDHIRATVWVDQQGDVKARRGKALSLRLDADEPTGRMTIEKPEKSPLESLYISQFSNEDFLIVIFDDAADFESLKDHVDGILEKNAD